MAGVRSPRYAGKFVEEIALADGLEIKVEFDSDEEAKKVIQACRVWMGRKNNKAEIEALSELDDPFLKSEKVIEQNKLGDKIYWRFSLVERPSIKIIGE